MKKFVLFMALVLLCSCSLAQERLLPRSYAELSKTKAQELAFQYCEDELCYPEDTIRVYHYLGDNEGWRFSFKVKEPDPTTNGLLIIGMDSKGNLTSAEGPQELMGIKEEVYITPPHFDRPVYQFIYALSSDIAYAQWITNDSPGSFNTDASDKRNHQVFGDQLPMNINVRIDAQTGDVVGDICVQLSGTDCIGDPMRFFLWEVESPESVSEE